MYSCNCQFSLNFVINFIKLLIGSVSFQARQSGVLREDAASQHYSDINMATAGNNPALYWKDSYTPDPYTNARNAVGAALKCSKCQMKYSNKNTYELHIKQCSAGNYRCVVCDKVYRSKTGLYNHRRAVHEHNQKYQCNQCGQKFQSNAHYYGHMNCHNNARPFICKQCGAGFAYKSNITKHQRMNCRNAQTGIP